MASFILSTTARNALANDSGLNELLANGSMKTYTSASPGPNNAASGTLLVTHTLPPAANNTPTGGVLALGAIANANGVANGTAGYCRFLTSANATIADGDCGTSGNTVVFDNTSIATNQVVSVTAANFTVPAGT